MDQIQQLPQQLALAKARGFDLYQQAEQQAAHIQMLSSMMGQIAIKVGITDLNSVSTDEFMNTIDKRLSSASAES